MILQFLVEDIIPGGEARAMVKSMKLVLTMDNFNLLIPGNGSSGSHLILHSLHVDDSSEMGLFSARSQVRTVK
jgi:hypothetical protein